MPGGEKEYRNDKTGLDSRLHGLISMTNCHDASSSNWQRLSVTRFGEQPSPVPDVALGEGEGQIRLTGLDCACGWATELSARPPDCHDDRSVIDRYVISRSVITNPS